MLRAFRSFMGESDMMAYLAMMTVRLIGLYRVLKQTGSLYLHCDPTASHYLKTILDAIFGGTNFRTEIIWKRSSAHSDGKQGRKQHGRIHDSIFFYTKSAEWTWNQLYTDYDEDYVQKFYKNIEEETGRRYQLDNITGPGGAAKGNPKYEVMGVERYWRYSQEEMERLIKDGRIIQTKPGNVPRYKRYLDEMPGVPIQDLWSDISPISSQANERLGYPTQKPIELLNRIIESSTNEGEVILDPFCGCGTSIHSAQLLNRKWIGIDVTHLAIAIIERRLAEAFPGNVVDVEGVPTTVNGATDLAERDKYQFQSWACALIGAHSYKGHTRGADGGIDGLIYFKPDGRTAEKVIVSVKGGNKVSVPMIRELKSVVDREKAKIGLFVTLAEPTKAMVKEAISAGFFEHDSWEKVPKIQIMTIRELLEEGRRPQIPALDPFMFKKAKREDSMEQKELFAIPRRAGRKEQKPHRKRSGLK